MRVFFEIHGNFRSRGNASFNSLSQIIKENNNKKVNIIALPKTNLYGSDLTGKLYKLPASFYLYAHNLSQ